MMAARGQTYGKRQQQIDAQRAVPMGRAPSDIQAAQVARQTPRPAAPGSLTAPTNRPNEPITAGAPFGPGVGPMAAGIPMRTPTENAVDEVRQIAMMYELDDLLDALDAYGGEL